MTQPIDSLRPMTGDEFQEVMHRHQPHERDGYTFCTRDWSEFWPCDAARLLRTVGDAYGANRPECDCGLQATLDATRAAELETGTCWFCKGSFLVDALIAGYDTFEEQRLACLACNERMSGNWRPATTETRDDPE